MLDVPDCVILLLNSVVHAVNQQKLGKATVPGGIFMEAFLYGEQRLHLYFTV